MQSYPPSQEQREQPPEGSYQPTQREYPQQPGYQQPYQQAMPGYPQPYPQPGSPQQYPPVMPYGAQQKDWLVTLLLCIFVGVLGVHRFYTGHVVIGIIQLLTLGGCGIWTLVDLIMIVTDNYRDANGLPLRKPI